ncbi:MAG: phosphate butyryltransferase [Bacteroidetes bacterium]|nr:phosphate butyryltransferase [Bacteroidota bacterium]
MITSFAELRSAALLNSGRRVIIVAPHGQEILTAAREAESFLGVHCVLVGDRKKIAADQAAAKMEIHDASTPQEALKTSLALINDGKGDILMKGSVDTSTLMKAVLDETAGLRTGRVLSDVVALEYGEGTEQRLVMITDGGVVTTPDLKTKRDLILNAVEVAHALGIDLPKVAVLSATEFVNPALQSTLDAAALSKMCERGQIPGCLVDGPLALDNALSREAAEEKGLRSPVAGHADILVGHSIEVSNSLAKGATYFAGLLLAHVIVGARVPVLISSRTDKSEARILSMAMGVLMSRKK